MMLATDYFESPVGLLEISATEEAVVRLQFVKSLGVPSPNGLIRESIRQLHAYFQRRSSEFTLPIAAEGTDFQKRVWQAVAALPYGSTATYKDIALSLQMAAGGSRAVGSANAKNPLLIIIPCHRVIKTNNDISGYAGGFRRKEYLLRHEGALGNKQMLFSFD